MFKVRRFVPVLALVAIGAALAGCQSSGPEEPIPPYYQDLAKPNAQVDPGTSVQMISRYRQNNGLSPVSIDSDLMQAAREQVQAVASSGDIRSSTRPQNQLKVVLSRFGDGNTDSTESVSAGYRTFAEAFSGWRESTRDNQTLLDAKATRMGIATAYVPNSKYQVFWVLIMAAPRGS